MKRHVRTMGFWFLAGVILAIGVAWAAAAWGTREAMRTAVAEAETATASWEVTRRSGWGTTVVEVSRYDYYGGLPETSVDGTLPPIIYAAGPDPTGLIPSWAPITEADDTNRNGEQSIHIYRLLASGWPMRCLWYRYDLNPSVVFASPNSRQGRPPVPGVVRGGITVRNGSARVLPLRPIWRGLIANSLLYSAILWAGWTALRAARRGCRLRRGCCPRCAYPIGVSVQCTECGSLVES